MDGHLDDDLSVSPATHNSAPWQELELLRVDALRLKDTLRNRVEIEMSELTSQVARLEREREQLVHIMRTLMESHSDMLSGWRYIREEHGDLHGVGWDRCEQSAVVSITLAKQWLISGKLV